MGTFGSDGFNERSRDLIKWTLLRSLELRRNRLRWNILQEYDKIRGDEYNTICTTTKATRNYILHSTGLSDTEGITKRRLYLIRETTKRVRPQVIRPRQSREKRAVPLEKSEWGGPVKDRTSLSKRRRFQDGGTKRQRGIRHDQRTVWTRQNRGNYYC